MRYDDGIPEVTPADFYATQAKFEQRRYGLWLNRTRREKQRAAILRRIWQQNSVKQSVTRPRNTRALSVVCVETGKCYPSISSAAKAYRCSLAAVWNAVNYGWRCAGKHWRAA